MRPNAVMPVHAHARRQTQPHDCETRFTASTQACNASNPVSFRNSAKEQVSQVFPRASCCPAPSRATGTSLWRLGSPAAVPLLLSSSVRRRTTQDYLRRRKIKAVKRSESRRCLSACNISVTHPRAGVRTGVPSPACLHLALPARPSLPRGAPAPRRRDRPADLAGWAK